MTCHFHSHQPRRLACIPSVTGGASLPVKARLLGRGVCALARRMPAAHMGGQTDLQESLDTILGEAPDEVVLEKRSSLGEAERNWVAGLHMACQSGESARVEQLLGGAVQLDQHALGEALTISCHNRQPAITRLLLGAGAPANHATAEASPLLMACQSGSAACVELLLSASALADGTSSASATPSFVAAYNGHVSCLSLLLAARAAVDVTYEGGWSSLHAACQLGHGGCVEALLAARASVHAVDDEEATPLHTACEGGQLECALLLIDAGASVNAEAADGGTPLFAAAFNENSELVPPLLAAGAAVDARTHAGTALTISASYGNLAMVQALLQAGADTRIVHEGRTAAEHARVYSHGDVVLAIEDAAARATYLLADAPSSSGGQLHERMQMDMEAMLTTVAEEEETDDEEEAAAVAGRLAAALARAPAPTSAPTSAPASEEAFGHHDARALAEQHFRAAMAAAEAAEAAAAVSAAEHELSEAMDSERQSGVDISADSTSTEEIDAEESDEMQRGLERMEAQAQPAVRSSESHAEAAVKAQPQVEAWQATMLLGSATRSSLAGEMQLEAQRAPSGASRSSDAAAFFASVAQRRQSDSGGRRSSGQLAAAQAAEVVQTKRSLFGDTPAQSPPPLSWLHPIAQCAHAMLRCRPPATPPRPSSSPQPNDWLRPWPMSLTPESLTPDDSRGESAAPAVSPPKAPMVSGRDRPVEPTPPRKSRLSLETTSLSAVNAPPPSISDPTPPRKSRAASLPEAASPSARLSALPAPAPLPQLARRGEAAAAGAPDGTAEPTPPRRNSRPSLESADAASNLMRAGHRANECGEFESARQCFHQSNELRPRPAARLSAANMALKLGDAAGAMEGYLALLRDGSLPGDHEVLQRKMREASSDLANNFARNLASKRASKTSS